jgi:exopolysaccharide production protein ExoY
VAWLGDSGAAAPPVAPEHRHAEGNGPTTAPPVRPPAAAAPPHPGSDSGLPVSAPAWEHPEISRPARSRAKRALDLTVAVGLAPVTITIGLVCAVLIKVTSRGPVMFAQERVGLGGERFRMYKFRTMHIDAERRLHQDPRLWQEYVENGFKVPAELDRRVTPLGRFLRRSSLDELPQMLNVLAGTMSLVGPRPVVPDELANYGDRRSVYQSVRPGITGAWQVNGRSTVDYPDRVDIDATYVRTWNVWLDVRILVRTPFAVISARGAH